MPDCSTARRCLRSANLGIKPPPSPTPITSVSSATPAVRSSADTTLTSKWYETGERHPSSVRPKRDKSHAHTHVFGPRSSRVCPPPRPRGLLRPLARDGCGARGGRLGIQVGAADDLRPQVAVEVVAQRDASGDVQPHHLVV